MVRLFLRELGLSKFNHLTDGQIEQLMEPADIWFDRTLIEREVGPHWLPATEDWVEYDRRILLELGVRQNVDSKARECERKWAAVSVEKRSNLLEGCKPALEELKSGDTNWQLHRTGIMTQQRASPMMA